MQTITVRAEPNVTPMIDVMLVLLIIFMSVGPLLVTGIVAEPPTGLHLADHPDAPHDAVIGIDASGRLFLDRQPVSERVLAERLAERFRRAPNDRVVYVRADRDLAYARVQEAMALASTAGARVVGLVSVRPPDERF
ncbi:MAG: biopolymer transporter ExbD [Gemmatimonadaceae bacterium]